MGDKLPTIVVVDDNSAVCPIFELGTEKLNVALKFFSSAAAAETYLNAHKPELLFLDIIMPDKDGLTFLQELRRHELHSDTSVVMISSKDYAQDRMTAKELGALDFVSKPITSQTIQDIIVKYAGAGIKE